ncbi:MAG: AarF/ABC1/UbiB kinase family protein [Salinisphaera sp.]|nr:AarF/ABC1/UbiB kinase family protein [Salinisphaera sp.]
MASDNFDSRDQEKRRRRKILGAGLRSLGRGAMRTMPGYDRAKSWHKTGQDWYDTLGGLKGAAMKLGQIASQYQDVLPPQLAEQLARLQRDAEPWDFADLEPVLDANWTDEQRNEVATIDRAALAAASIGQVHAATLADGRSVVIKIRYPGVADSIDADIANLGRLLKLSRFLPIRGRDLDAVLGELRDRFVEETDYRREVLNLKVLRGMRLRDFAMPEAVPHLCTEAVLVTTRLDASPVDAADPHLGQSMIEAINRQVFTFGALHADPHPGNFGITDDGRIALYDYGCVKYLDVPTRLALRDIIAAALVGDWRGVHDGMERLGAVDPGSWEKHGDVYAEIYERHARSAIDPLREQPVYTFTRDNLIESIRGEIGRSLKYWKYFNAAPEMVFVMRTLSGLYWILRRMGGQANLYNELERLAAGEYGPYEPSKRASSN